MHDRVEDVDRGLGQQREQDRVAPVRLPTRQGLRGEPTADLGEVTASFGGSADMSSVSASRPRKNFSFSTSPPTLLGDASTGPVTSQCKREDFSFGSMTSSPSSPRARSSVSRWATRAWVSCSAA
ncbi:hypothetical protein ACWGJX_40065 [Streptomyces sp. NPDC054775]